MTQPAAPKSALPIIIRVPTPTARVHLLDRSGDMPVPNGWRRCIVLSNLTYDDLKLLERCVAEGLALIQKNAGN